MDKKGTKKSSPFFPYFFKTPSIDPVAITIIFLFILLISSVILAVSIGPASIPSKDVWQIFFNKSGLTARGNWSTGSENIVWLIRFPRVLLALVVGSGLAVVGVSLQAMVRNPLADSYILGISSGASVGAVIAISMGLSSLFGNLGVQLGGFLGALLSFIIVFLIANEKGKITPGRLILSGIGVGYIFSGITSFITLTSSSRSLAGQVLSWTLGSLARATWFDLTVPSVVLLLAVFYLIMQARNLNALAVGDETATTLGLEADIFRQKLFVLTALITGVMVAVSGTIGFIGLIVPHVVRLFFRSDHRRVLPISALVGSIFLIWVDVIARTSFAPKELPVGVITSVLGGPIFILLLLRRGRFGKEAFHES